MADNEKRTARIPIVLDDINNRSRHKDKELSFDYVEEDIYIKRDGRYINITGEIRETVAEIRDGSSVIHIVTEESLPDIKDREKNHWYFVITKSEDYKTEDEVDMYSYIYYGVVNADYYKDKAYLLIAQNMIINPGSVKMKMIEGYKGCFYVPTVYAPVFYNDETGEKLEFTVQDRLYCLTPDNVSIPYDVYISDEENLGEIYIRAEFTGNDWYVISIVSNDDQISGLEFPVNEVKVEDGSAIGSIPDPIWTAPRYIFKGWSLKKAEYVPIDPTTYIPTDNIKLYAYFEYDNNNSKYTYKAIYSRGSNLILGTFYSVAAPNTKIAPKPYAGYTSTDVPATLVKEGQIIQFENYNPISYNIIYALDGGILTGQQTSYDIEDIYTPPTPYKDGYTFQRWSPRRIDIGTTGPITFTAIWDKNSVIKSGTALKTAILTLNPNIQTLATSIVRSSSEPKAITLADAGSTINVAAEGSPIYMWYDGNGNIMYYSEYEVAANADMSGAFEGFIKLRSISPLIEWEMGPDTVINNMFKGCSALSDLSPLEKWNLTGGNFKDAFTGTAAAIAGRVPNWYAWKCTVRYISTHIVSGNPTNKLLRSEQYTKMPGTSFVPSPSSKINYYTIPTDSITPIQKDQIIEVRCAPTIWNITYNLDGGSWGPTVQQDMIRNQYAYEDISESPYVPPQDLIKDGFTFKGWRPSNMPIGTTGDFTFTAIWS